MSIIRKNWSALSTLARQWTVEDEEEVEREKRRKTRESAADEDDSPTEETEPHTISDADPAEADYSSGDSGGGLTQLQFDFVEMLRVRDERRRMRHVETLRKQKEQGEGDQASNLEEKPRVEFLGEAQDEDILKSIQQCIKTYLPSELSYNSMEAETLDEKKNQDTNTVSSSNQPRNPPISSQKFVSSLSFSFDKCPSSPQASSRVVSPLSPRTLSPQSQRESPHSPAHSLSPTRSGSMSPCTLNGDSARHENGSVGNFEAAEKPAFTRQSSRTISFRMMKKKEENMPLQRSASVRVPDKSSESHKSSNQDEEQLSSFQRNARQRLSSRSIQEKMERLAQASQKWEISKSPSIHKTVCLADEVSRKRGFFEKDSEEPEPDMFSKQDFRSLSSGISDRINRWVQRKTFSLSSSHSPTDLRHVSISSKKTLFERGKEQEK